MSYKNKNGIVYADDIEDACGLALVLIESEVGELQRLVLNIDQHVVNIGSHQFNHASIKLLQANQKHCKRLIVELNKTLEALKFKG